MLSLRTALRLSASSKIAFVGAGGKTTAMFSLAHQLDPPVIVTATTHMGIWELKHADTIYLSDSNDLSSSLEGIKPEHGVILFLGPLGKSERYDGLPENLLKKIHTHAEENQIPLLIEADGSRMLPLKAPASHEPPIPEFVDIVVVVAGMSAIGKPLSDGIVHRPEIYSKLSGIQPGDLITPEAALKVFCHQSGGLKNIPPHAKKILLLNQLDTQEQQIIAQEIARMALSCYDRVIGASLGSATPASGNKDITLDHITIESSRVLSVYEHIAGIILAAGESYRFGHPKQLLELEGEPLLRKITNIVLGSNLSEVIVVVGANAERILPVLEGLPVITIFNPFWQKGQSSSIHAGIESLSNKINAAIFILADQPYISNELIRTLMAEHNATLAPIVAPIVDGQRGNPVLFDRVTFPDLMKLTGNEGGRAIIDRFAGSYIRWQDPRILMDIDTPEDYLRIKYQGYGQS